MSRHAILWFVRSRDGQQRRLVMGLPLDGLLRVEHGMAVMYRLMVLLMETVVMSLRHMMLITA